ncbi:NAD-dependent epimerase/dehydratase family protein, partial [Bacillus thuringiensis]|uniref:NAD-dependent epimerase/dehydratase family protein n=1 Tax=Bacillus thuringiensis TaxID=1428 RepID=UPI003D6C711A
MLSQLIHKHNLNNIIFSSSPTLYPIPQTSPITHHFPLTPTNPYPQTKLIIHQIIPHLPFPHPQSTIP